METVLTKDEIKELMLAYKTIEKLVEKYVPKEEIYKAEFLKDMEEAENEIANGELIEVDSLEDLFAY